MAEYDSEYARYLAGRSWKSLLYRRRFLYPRLCRHLHGRVLDVGCGIGDMLAFRPGTEGVDPNPHTVAICRRRGLPAQIVDPERLPYDDRVFNGAIMDNVLEHIVEPAPILREVHRVIAPGGVFICGVPGRCGYAADPDHKRFYDEAALCDTAESHGFRKRLVFHAPTRNSWLERNMRQYCVYGIFVRI